MHVISYGCGWRNYAKAHPLQDSGGQQIALKTERPPAASGPLVDPGGRTCHEGNKSRKRSEMEEAGGRYVLRQPPPAKKALDDGQRGGATCMKCVSSDLLLS